MKDRRNDRPEDHWKNLELRFRAWDPIQIDLEKAAEELEEAGCLLLEDRSNCFELADGLITERSHMWRWIKSLQLWKEETLDLRKDLRRIRELSIMLCRALADREYVYSKYETETETKENDPEQIAPEKTYKTKLGRIIDQLRNECNWSEGDLEHFSDIDKSRIISHIKHGKKPHHKTLQKYEAAFSKKLKREIKLEDLL
jgi:hypothetical protein